jgi:hypothetical protein
MSSFHEQHAASRPRLTHRATEPTGCRESTPRLQGKKSGEKTRRVSTCLMSSFHEQHVASRPRLMHLAIEPARCQKASTPWLKREGVVERKTRAITCLTSSFHEHAERAIDFISTGAAVGAVVRCRAAAVLRRAQAFRLRLPAPASCQAVQGRRTAAQAPGLGGPGPCFLACLPGPVWAACRPAPAPQRRSISHVACMPAKQ